MIQVFNSKTLSFTSWGLKDSKHDIGPAIMGLVNAANTFIVVGGYNFSFQTTGFHFFDSLENKVKQGIPVLMIIPPKLTGFKNKHAAMVDHCLKKKIALLYNGYNHSKWLLTENGLYFGSSNFTKTSWEKRVEVVSLHSFSPSPHPLERGTVQDFLRFIQMEIKAISSRPTMKKALPRYTRYVWRRIEGLLLKLNPSVKKVQQTLENYETVELLLGKVQQHWFVHYDPGMFSLMQELNSRIMRRVDVLCQYAYEHIYNEMTSQDDQVGQQEIARYNRLHASAIREIERCIEQLENLSWPDQPGIRSDQASQNLENLRRVEQALLSTLGRDNLQ